MVYLLDTNVCIAAMRGNESVRARLTECRPDEIGVSTVAVFELFVAVAKCRLPEVEGEKVKAFLKPLHLLPFDELSALKSAEIHGELETRGQKIGPYDLQIAGQALALDVILITHNVEEFGRVAELRLEDWEDPS